MTTYDCKHCNQPMIKNIETLLATDKSIGHECPTCRHWIWRKDLEEAIENRSI